MIKKSNKQAVSLRLDESTIEILKSRSDSVGKSQADLVQESLNLTFFGKDTKHLLLKLEDVTRELQIAKQDYDELSRKTGKKISRMKRITMSLNKDEFKLFKNASTKRDLPMSTMMRELIFRKVDNKILAIDNSKNIPELTVS